MLVTAMASATAALWGRLRLRGADWMIALTAPVDLVNHDLRDRRWLAMEKRSFAAWAGPSLFMMTASGMIASLLVMFLL